MITTMGLVQSKKQITGSVDRSRTEWSSLRDRGWATLSDCDVQER